jgi:plastocyanin
MRASSSPSSASDVRLTAAARDDGCRPGAVAAALALALACAGTVAGAAPPAPREHTVAIDGMAFQPATLRVRRGDRVVWVNRDLVPHTATATDRSFDSGRIAAGQRWAFVAERSGTIAYDCTYHPAMTAAIVVE